MKQYEAETGDIATWHWHDKEFLTDDYIAWLESQLIWRPVAQKPDKNGMYLCIVGDGLNILLLYENGEWFEYDTEFGWFINNNPRYWLPIPKIQEI